MYEFQYRPSFVSDDRPQELLGDHADELFSVWGAPFLKGNVFLLAVFLVILGLSLCLALMALSEFLLLNWLSLCFVTGISYKTVSSLSPLTHMMGLCYCVPRDSHSQNPDL